MDKGGGIMTNQEMVDVLTRIRDHHIEHMSRVIHMKSIESASGDYFDEIITREQGAIDSIDKAISRINSFI